MQLLLVLAAWLPLVPCQNPVFRQTPKYYNISDPADSGTAHGGSKIALSQGFQTVYAGSDAELSAVSRFLFDFSYCCNSTNTTFEYLQQINFNNLQYVSIQQQPKMALIQRGYCLWSEKVRLALNISRLNNLDMAAILLYDNNTQTTVSYQLKDPDSVTYSDISYASPLPSSENISYMPDNDLLNSNGVSLPVYFSPYGYGQQLQSLLNGSSTTMDGSYKVFWQLTVYPSIPSSAGDNNGQMTINKGYLATIIALAAILLVALFAGILFLRWWRLRQLREQMEYDARVSAHAYNMQMRRKAKPLPVSVVNAIPIEKYTPDKVKNASCAICLEDFEENTTEVRILGCGHGFCVLCIDPWLTQKSTICPVCKYDCLPPEMRKSTSSTSGTNDAAPINNNTSSNEPGPSRANTNNYILSPGEGPSRVHNNETSSTNASNEPGPSRPANNNTSSTGATKEPGPSNADDHNNATLTDTSHESGPLRTDNGNSKPSTHASVEPTVSRANNHSNNNNNNNTPLTDAAHESDPLSTDNSNN